MDWPTFIAAFFAGVAAILNIIYTYYNTKKTNFINVITSERIKWMSELRRAVSNLCSGLNRVMNTYQQGPLSPDKMEEIEMLITLVRLLLNRKEKKHKAILKRLKKIPKYMNSNDHEGLKKTLNKIVDSTQELLKETWEIVKKEAKDGELIQVEDINWWLKK